MMKKSLLFLCFCVLCSFHVMAQGPQNDGLRPPQDKMMRPTPQQRAERLAKQLSLTDAVKNNVQVFYQQQDSVREASRAAFGNLSRDERRAKMDEMRKQEETELSKILGPEKYKQYQDMREKQMQKMRERQGEGRPEQQ